MIFGYRPLKADHLSTSKQGVQFCRYAALVFPRLQPQTRPYRFPVKVVTPQRLLEVGKSCVGDSQGLRLKHCILIAIEGEHTWVGEASAKILVLIRLYSTSLDQLVQYLSPDSYFRTRCALFIVTNDQPPSPGTYKPWTQMREHNIRSMNDQIDLASGVRFIANS